MLAQLWVSQSASSTPPPPSPPPTKPLGKVNFPSDLSIKQKKKTLQGSCDINALFILSKKQNCKILIHIEFNQERIYNQRYSWENELRIQFEFIAT